VHRSETDVQPTVAALNALPILEKLEVRRSNKAEDRFRRRRVSQSDLHVQRVKLPDQNPGVISSLGQQRLHLPNQDIGLLSNRISVNDVISHFLTPHSLDYITAPTSTVLPDAFAPAKPGAAMQLFACHVNEHAPRLVIADGVVQHGRARDRFRAMSRGSLRPGGSGARALQAEHRL